MAGSFTDISNTCFKHSWHIRCPQASFTDLLEGTSSEAQVRHSTSFGVVGIAGSVLRRSIDPMIVGVDSRLLGLRGAFSVTLVFACSLIEASFAEEVLALFNDERGLDDDLEDLLVGRSPICDMLSSGVTSDSITVGRLCLFEELDCVERRLGSGLYRSSSRFVLSEDFEGTVFP